MKHRMLAFVFAMVFISVVGCSAPRAGGSGPDSPDVMRVATYNTYYVFNKGTEIEAGTDWLAAQAFDIVALQELTNISHDRLAELALGWGHEHSALLKTSGFSVGLTSNRPIETVSRMVDGLHHGMLHVRVSGIDVLVVHLSPFRWEVRQSEAALILEYLRPLQVEGRHVIVLGDFNALSADDRALLAAQPELLEKHRESDETHGHVENLRDEQFDFSVMQAFLNAGLSDVSLPFFEKVPDVRWTYPTGIWDEEEHKPPVGGSRIDYVLMNDALAARVVHARVVRQGVVNRVSDHYPVVVDLRWPTAPE